MSIKIKQIYVKNYKLFDEKLISFADDLSVFDGPNGYGKTSIFDAIEFLITGKINRVEKSDVISGAKSYRSNFLAKDSGKEVLIKGEFSNSSNEQSLIIALKIPAIFYGSKSNNPKNICELAEVYILSQFDLTQAEWGRSLNKQQIEQIRNNFFGKQNIGFYKNFHYVQQEDRLAYFKNSEKERIEEINELFGMANENDKLQRAATVSRQLSTRLNSLIETINNKINEISQIQNNDNKQVEYIALFDGKQEWDKQNLSFNGANSKNVYNKYLNELNALKVFSDFKDIYVIDKEIKQYENVRAEDRSSAIRAWAVEQNDSETLKFYYNISGNVKFFKEQLSLAEQMKYLVLNYNRICDILELKEDKDAFNNILANLKAASANQSSLQKSISYLNDLRNNLRAQSEKMDKWDDNKCPYCGKVYNDVNELTKKFTETEALIAETLGRESLEVKKLAAELKNTFTTRCYRLMQEYVSTYQKESFLELFTGVESLEQLRAMSLKCAPLLKRLEDRVEIKLARQSDCQSFVGYAAVIQDAISELKNSLPAEYLNASRQYEFDYLYKSIVENKNNLNLLDKDKIDLKIQYIRNQYNASFDRAKKQLKECKEQYDELLDIKKSVDNYKSALKDSLNNYRNQVIKQIEIPFFLYSSRLLQSYQSGQGVMIRSDGESIRFCVPGGEHDVLYTMSSGQLSAVLLSFSLALNKIYAGENFNTLLIDDPIQCMDDINMLSFVELLRQEFEGAQIIMSTHEDAFSNFIRYKFGKLNQNCMQINLHG